MKGSKLFHINILLRDRQTPLCRATMLLFFILTIFSGTLCSCGDSVEEQRRISRAERKRLADENRRALKIAVTPTLDCLPLFIAKEKGLYEQAGEDIRLKAFNAHMDCDTAFVGGSVEGMVSDLVRTEWLKQNKKVELEYLSSTSAAWQLLANRKSRIKRMEQLSDKMVAMTRFSATDALTSMATDGVKMKAELYRIQVNDVNVRLSMLYTNGVEAAWLQEPFATLARQRNATVITDSKRLKFTAGVIAFRSETMKDKKRKSQISAFTKVYNMACDSINKHGLPYYSDIINKYCGVDDETVKAIPAVRFNHIAAPKDEYIEMAKAALKKLKD